MKIGLVYSQGDFKEAFPNDFEGRNNIADDIEVALKNLKLEFKRIPANKEMFKILEKEKFDLIFNAADEGFEMNTQLEAHVPAVLDLYKIPYTGSNYLTLGTCVNKFRTKQILKMNNLPTPNFELFEEKINKNVNLNGLRFPLIVKPSQEDGSIGIKENSVVETKEDLIKKVNEVLEKYKQPALVEEFIDGREIYVGVIGREEIETLPMTEINFTLPEGYKNFLPYEAKWNEESVYYKNTTPVCPAKIDKKLKDELERIAKKAYKIFQVRDYGRIDFRIGKNNEIFILEVNPNPDLSMDTGVSRMAKAKGMTYEDLIKKIISFSKKRK